MSDDSFDRFIRSRAAQVREERGPCPPSEELLRYASGRSNSPQLRDHIARCGSCDAIVSLSARPAWWKRPFPAYALCAALLIAWAISASLVPRREILSPAPSAHLAAVNVLPLDQTRADGPPKARKDQSFLLSFTIPYRPDRQYRARLLDPADTTVAEFAPVRALNEQGSCLLRFDRGQLAPQLYRLIVDDQSGNEFHFLFRLE